jgi:aspartyl/glutamyl-tRNA(Asn/Gln) amidotransferase C subunit
MSFTEQDLDNLSRLARITITAEEKPKMLVDIQSILGYISEINEVTGEATHIEGAFNNIVRDDVITREPGSHTEALLREAPEVQGEYVKVKQVLKQ